MKKRFRKPLSICIATLMLMSLLAAIPGMACLAEGNDAAQVESTDMEAIMAKEDAVYAQAGHGDGIINTFIGEKLSDEKIKDQDDALKCIKSVFDRIGGDETTELLLESIRPNDQGMAVVTFTQRAGEMLVYGATVKLILDKDDYPIALLSSIMPNVDIRDIKEWAVDDKAAEQIAMDQVKASGSKEILVEGATQKVIIPMQAMDGRYECAWVVYTTTLEKEMNDQAYTAHYVNAEGDYLYSTPVFEPGDEESISGQSTKSTFDFDTYEPGEITVTVQLDDGAKEITMPVLKDTATGKTYLGDAKRKILCADMAEYFGNNKVAPIETQDGVEPVDADIYNSYINVWDFYASFGWTGPDGEGTPSLLLMNYVDDSGNPVVNACYIKKQNGFQVFGWSRAVDFGKSIDIVAHEFTHCMTGKAMIYNIYTNDPGAINEGFSDILGNLVEMKFQNEDEKHAWLINEAAGPIWRNMADPHEYSQPEFVWDVYYAPKPSKPTGNNDQGGVHVNSSLLSLISYKLYQAGMSVSEQGYFWVNTALIITPQTDYPMMAEILPWVMHQLGYDQHLDALNKAIEETKLTVTEDPGTIPAGYGALTFDFATVKEQADAGCVSLTCLKAPEADIGKRTSSWPVEGTTIAKMYLPAGEYYVIVRVADSRTQVSKQAILSGDGWTLTDKKDSESYKAIGTTVSVKAGEVTEISSGGFEQTAAEILQEFEKMHAEQ